MISVINVQVGRASFNLALEWAIFFVAPYPGMESNQLQAQDKPHWPCWLPEHCDGVSRRIPLCFRGKGMYLATHGLGSCLVIAVFFEVFFFVLFFFLHPIFFN